MNDSQEADSPTSKKKDNPLTDIIVNVILPVLILSHCSKDGEKSLASWPLCRDGDSPLPSRLLMGVWHFIQHKKLNTFSAVGVFNVLLTGLITIYLFSDNDPGTRKNAPLLFGIKEAVQPLILGSLFLITHRSATPLFNAFVYNDAIFDHGRINQKVNENGKKTELEKLLWSSTILFFGSFCLSAAMNLGLAFYFLNDLDPMAENWKELYNKDVGAHHRLGLSGHRCSPSRNRRIHPWPND